MESVALKALGETIREFNGDPHRIYLTGLSMGGYGTWRLGANHPGRFAALVPICGGIRPPPRIRLPRGSSLTPPPGDPYAATAKKIGKTPVWVFHGDTDPTVPVTESRKMVEALKSAGGNVMYTEYEGVGHNSLGQGLCRARIDSLAAFLQSSLTAGDKAPATLRTPRTRMPKVRVQAATCLPIWPKPKRPRTSPVPLAKARLGTDQPAAQSQNHKDRVLADCWARGHKYWPRWLYLRSTLKLSWSTPVLTDRTNLNLPRPGPWTQ